MDLDYFGIDGSDEEEEPVTTPSQQPSKVRRTDGHLGDNCSDISHLYSISISEEEKTSAEMEAFLDAASTDEGDNNGPNVDLSLNQSDAFDPNQLPQNLSGPEPNYISGEYKQAAAEVSEAAEMEAYLDQFFIDPEDAPTIANTISSVLNTDATGED